MKMDNKEGCALLIIDVQVGLFAREKFDGKKIFQSEELLRNISEVAEKARKSNVPVIYFQFTGSDDSIMGKGNPFWEVHPQVKPQEGDLIMVKNHADSFLNTSLHEKLQCLHVKDLVIMGIQTDYCVDTTCRSAFALGYNTTLISDGHSTFDSGVLPANQIVAHHNYALGGGDPYAVKFVTLKKAGEIAF